MGEGMVAADPRLGAGPTIGPPTPSDPVNELPNAGTEGLALGPKVGPMGLIPMPVGGVMGVSGTTGEADGVTMSPVPIPNDGAMGPPTVPPTVPILVPTDGVTGAVPGAPDEPNELCPKQAGASAIMAAARVRDVRRGRDVI
jgi:hypothetical protein